MSDNKLSSEAKQRIRSLGYFPGQSWLRPGPLNSLTDVPGVSIGVRTLQSGEWDPSKPGESIIRSGVTIIQPRSSSYVLTDPVFASIWALNGPGEFSGSHMISELGKMQSPIALGGTTGVGAMHEGVARHAAALPRKDDKGRPMPYFVLPVVAETSDTLSDQFAFPLTVEHVKEAFEDCKERRPAHEFEGGVGGGTGMCCLGFKGGNGTSSRIIPNADGNDFVLGAFVQANFGAARDLKIGGHPFGRMMVEEGFHGEAKLAAEREHGSYGEKLHEGSILIVLGTDAPMLPHQLARLCRRAPIGLSRVGAVAHHLSGDIVLSFSTQSTVPPTDSTVTIPDSTASVQKFGPLGLPVPRATGVQTITEDGMNAFFYAVADVVEEAVLNALCAGRDMVGSQGFEIKGLPHEKVKKLFNQAS